MNNDQIAAAILRKVHMLLLQYLPRPDCAQKRLKQARDIEVVKKKVAQELWPENSGVNIDIKV